jgi:hypothetical protein
MTKNNVENSTKKLKESKKIGRPKLKKTRLAISDEVYRKIARIAEESRIPMQLVYEDALLNGLVTLKEMYASAIAYRATRDGMINELDKRVVQERKPQRGQGAELGEPSQPDYREIPAEFEYGSTENGSGDVALQRGLEAEDGAYIEPDPVP